MTLERLDELCARLLDLTAQLHGSIAHHVNTGNLERAARLEKAADLIMRHYERHEKAAHVLRMQRAIGSGIGDVLVRTDALGRAA